MRRLLSIALIAASLGGGAAWADDPFKAGLQAEACGDSETALKCFLSADRAKPNDAKIAQRLARQYSDLCDFQPTAEKQKDYAERALQYSQLADKLEPRQAEHVLSLAISYGKLGRLSDSNRTKIQYSRLVHQEAEEAVALDPNYAWAHYVIGRWNYEVALLGRSAKFFASLLYGGLGEGSFAVAIRELRRATELDATEPAMWIDLGFAYQAAGQPEEARKAWQKGVALPGTARFQSEAKDRAKSALAKS